MSWLQLKIETTIEYAEQINVFLNLFDAVAVTLQDAADQPLLEPDPDSTPLWQEIQVLSLFSPHTNTDNIVNFLKKELGEPAVKNFHTEIISDQNWERAWLKDFHAMQFGKNLWICPSVETPPDPNAVNIILDPGLAFGTGTHPTTALCLEWLDAHPPIDKTVIDYGCGSGILAIAALKLGAKEVLAVDHDMQALEATKANAERNNIDLAKLHIALPNQHAMIKADLLISNIVANPLMQLAALFAELVKPNGNLVLAGILDTQVDSVKNIYQQWFEIKNMAQKEEWVRLSFIRRARA